MIVFSFPFLSLNMVDEVSAINSDPSFLIKLSSLLALPVSSLSFDSSDNFLSSIRQDLPKSNISFEVNPNNFSVAGLTSNISPLGFVSKIASILFSKIEQYFSSFSFNFFSILFL